MEQLDEEARYHREQHQLLQEMVEPFKEQLEGFEMEKRALLSQSEAAQGEVKVQVDTELIFYSLFLAGRHQPSIFSIQLLDFSFHLSNILKLPVNLVEEDRDKFDMSETDEQI